MTISTYDETVTFLTLVCQDLNEQYFEGKLPPVVVTVQSSEGAYGHYYTKENWQGQNEAWHEINISAEYLRRGIYPTIATLQHEMIHHYCNMNGIQDTSRQGRYHNKRFKEEAEKRGLKITHDERIGWSVTQLHENMKNWIDQQNYPQITLYRKMKDELMPPVQPTTPTPLGKSGTIAGTEVTTRGKHKTKTIIYKCPSCKKKVKATEQMLIGCYTCAELMIEEV